MRSPRLFLLAPFLAQLIAAPVLAQTVYEKQTGTTPFGAKISSLAINTTQWTGWVQVDTQRSVTFDIDYVRGAGAASAVTLRCQTWGTVGAQPANGSGRDLHVLTGTDATGLTTSVPLTLSNAVAGDESWTWTITNIPAPFINCGFAGTGANANDRLTVFERGLTP